MPYVVVRDEGSCSTAKPWAVKTQGGQDDGRVHGCHATKEHAQAQQRALYANQPPEAEAQANGGHMTTTEEHGLTPAEYEALRASEPDELRAKYNAEQLQAMQKAGHTFPGTTSYPIGDAEDLANAIRAVGRGGANHDAIRKYVIGRAKAMGMASKIPDNWNADGSMRAAVEVDLDIDSHKIAEAVAEPATKRSFLTNTIEARKRRLPRRGDREERALPLERLTISESQQRAFDANDNDGKPLLRFDGYASVFNRRYQVGSYEEEIAPGAFKRSLAQDNLDVVLRVEHTDLPIARTTGQVTLADGSTAPTLRLSEDAEGLHVEALLDPEDPDVARLVPKYRRGDLKEMSFAFRCNNDAWTDDYSTRTIRDANIHRGDVSIVTFGASPTTNSSMRSEGALDDVRGAGFERFMEAMVEWRDLTLLPPEERLGRMLSADSQSFLSNMLDLFATADEAVDEGQARLSDFIGVANPDKDGPWSSDEDDDAESDEDVTSSERTEEEEDEPLEIRDAEYLAIAQTLKRGK